MRWLRLCLLAMSLCWLPAQAQRLPEPAQWTYDIRGQLSGLPLSASATLTWQHEGQRYTAQLAMQSLLTGRRTQTSTGNVRPEGLRPESFVDERRRTVRQLTPDWATQRYQVQPGAAWHALPAFSQDRLSVFLQLGWLLSALPTPPATGHTWRLHVMGQNGAQEWAFVSQGVQTIDLPHGQHVAWRIDRQTQDAQDTQASLWFVPSLSFLPARIRLTEPDGDSVDQRLRAIGRAP